MSKVIHRKLLDVSEASSTELFELIKRNGVMYIEPKWSTNLFSFLARTVVGQQLSAKAAGAIWDRIELCASSSETTLTNLFGEAFEQDVRACGISKNTADMIAIFFCGLQDVYPDTDVAIDHGLLTLIGSYSSPETLAELYKPSVLSMQAYLARNR